MQKVRKSLRIFQQGIFGLLMGVLVAVILTTTLQLVVDVVEQVLDPPALLLDPDELEGIVGLFLNVLIALELFAILEVLLLENIIHVEFVMAVALIAVSREVLILELRSTAPLKLVGLATLILALAVGYYLVKKKESATGTGQPAAD